MKKYLHIIAITVLMLGSIKTMAQQPLTLSLRQAMEKAARSNRQVLINEMENRKSEGYVKETESYLKPSVEARGNYMVYAERPVIFMRNEATNNKVEPLRVGGRHVFNGAITAQYPLLDPFARSRVNHSRILSELQHEKTKQIINETKLSAGQLYLGILLYKEQLKHLEASRQRNEQALRESKMLFLQGKALKTDTLSHSIAVQTLESTIYQAEVEMESALLRLKQFLAMRANEPVELTDGLALPVSYFHLSADSLIATARQQRPDLSIRKLAIIENEEKLHMTNAEFKPRLSAFAQYQLQSQSDNLAIWNYKLPRTSYAGLQLTVPIFSGKRQQYKTEQARYGIAQSRMALEEAEAQITTEILTLKSALQDAFNRKEVQQKNMEAAAVQYNMFKERYRYGLSTRLELSDAELLLTRARIGYAESQYLIALKQLELENALGY